MKVFHSVQNVELKMNNQMHKTINLIAVVFLLVSFSCSTAPSEEAIQNMPSPIATEQYILYENFPTEISTPRNVEVWLPKLYEITDSLAVLYMFDGQNIFHGTRGWGGEYNEGWQVDEKLDSLMEAGIIPPVMVVGIFNAQEKRGIEYMPAKPKDLISSRAKVTEHPWYMHYKDNPPESDEHLRFIVEELKPYIDAHYKTKSDVANTFIGGSSMGGLMSAYAICEYPEVFGGAACFSTHWSPLDGVFVEYIKENLPDPANHKIYFDYGTEGLDGEYEPFQQIVNEAMSKKGFVQGENWMTQKFEGEDHHEKFWRGRFPIPMEFLLGK